MTRRIATGNDRLQTDSDALRIVGTRYGRLTVTGIGERTGAGKRQFTCRCECGVVKDVAWSALKRGLTRSCGCLRTDLGSPARTHGRSHAGDYLYSLWKGIRWRVNPNFKRYNDWGGRGIRLHDDWGDFLAFREDVLAEIGDRPSPLHSLDRIDNDGNYEPGNIRWATAIEQSHNKRRQGNQWTNA